MKIIFETIDKTNRKIHLSRERLKHISKHPHMHEPIDNIELTLKNPTTIRYFEDDENIRYFYKEFKHMDSSERYLLVAVNYFKRKGVRNYIIFY
ncbi:MAG: hypothetical protein IIA87_01720 [Nanoarchaeota archaeon]|nr:hypothetical protein [Nanoarchaeota archaeon]